MNAVADSRIQAVIVTAPKDLMEQIAGMMNDLDVPSTRDQKVYVFHMDNGDPQQAVQVLQNMFQTQRLAEQRQQLVAEQRADAARAEQHHGDQLVHHVGHVRHWRSGGGTRTGGGSQF